VLENNTPHTIESSIEIPRGFPTSQPYWLRISPKKALFSVSDQSLIGAAENEPSLQVKIALDGLGEDLEFLVPVYYRWTDRVDGESYRLFEVRPKVTVEIEDGVRVFADTNPQELRVRVKVHTSGVEGTLRLSGDSDWRVVPESIDFSLSEKYDEAEFSFEVTPPDDAGDAVFLAEANVGGTTFSRALVTITHPHIKRQVYFPESTLKVVKLDVNRRGDTIGYIMGSGDEVAEGLRRLGYEVILLTDEELESGDLGRFDAIVAGIRAYNTRERLAVVQPRLLQYVEDGGTLIVQYSVSRGLVTEELGPYEFTIGRDRVSEENAPVTILAPDHVLMTFPNTITQKDFDGWVQERGLYFATQWDDRYETVVASHDKGEPDTAGGLVFTRFGDGVFIYSGISWFRQLPAGVPGAYRLLANLISSGKVNED